MKIFIANLPFSITEADLFAAFSKFGSVSGVILINDRISGKSRGFGFLEMPDEHETNRAISGLNGAEVEGREIVVRLAGVEAPEKPKPTIKTVQDTGVRASSVTKRPRRPIH